MTGRIPEVLLHEDVWGSLIGAFELNNLALCVQSPIEQYFLDVDELPDDEKARAQVVTQALLDALDHEYDAVLEVRM